MYLNANYAHKEEIMNHNFPCTPEGGKISQLNPIIDYYKSILGGIYVVENYIFIRFHNNMQVCVI